MTTSGTPEGLSVYGRFGKPCPRCATPIEVRKHGEQARVTYWCPGCQLYIPLPEPDPDAMAAEGSGRGRRFAWRRKNRRGDDPSSRNGAGHPDASSDGMAFAGYDESVTPYPKARDEHARVGRYEVRSAADDVRFDPHPAARAFMAGRSYDLSPSYVDPLLAPDA